MKTRGNNMKKLKNTKIYNKPLLKKHGDITTITKGGWPTGEEDGTSKMKDS